MPSLLLLLLAAGPAHAQESSDPRLAQAAARGLFEQALDAFDAGDWERAEGLFRESLEVSWAASPAVNLAEVLTRRGANAEARALLLRVSEDPEVPVELRDTARQRREQLASEVAVLRVERDGVGTITVDGEPLQNSTVELDPGEHELAGIGPPLRVTLFAGQPRTVRYPQAAVPSAEETAENAVEQSVEPGADGGGDDGVLIGVLVGVGVALALAAAIIIGVVVADSSNGATNTQLMPPVFEIAP